MADREDNVYMAKLAEQAERYDGLYSILIHKIRLSSNRRTFLVSRNVRFNEKCRCNGYRVNSRRT